MMVVYTTISFPMVCHCKNGLMNLKRWELVLLNVIHFKLMKIEDLITEIEKSPGMYLGRPSITRLSAFIDGYLLGVASDEPFLGGFQKWIASKYEVKSTHKWSEIILFFEQGEEQAFARFFELLREFRTLEATNSND